MRIDTKKLKAAIHSTNNAIRAQKRLIRGKESATDGEWAELRALKGRSTVLCAIAAHARRRIHRQGSSLEAQAQELGRAAEEFAPAVVAQAA